MPLLCALADEETVLEDGVAVVPDVEIVVLVLLLLLLLLPLRQ